MVENKHAGPKANRSLNYFKSFKWLLLAYDSIGFLVISFVYYVKCNSSIGVDNIFINVGIAIALLLICRILGQIYKQIYRYGGVSSFLRLILVDVSAALVHYFASLISGLPTGGAFILFSLYAFNCWFSLFMRICYRFAYTHQSYDNLIGKLSRLSIRVATFNSQQIEIKKMDNSSSLIKIAIVGAGSTGVGLAEELLMNTHKNYLPEVFIDIDKGKTGRKINNIPVLGEEEITKELLEQYGIQHIVFALPDMPVEEKRKLYEQYSEFGYKILTYDQPTMSTNSHGKKSLREFDIEELLFRKQTNVINDEIINFYEGKVVLITGGGGSIGSELTRQIAKMKPKQIIILDVYENGAYDVQQELKIQYKDDLDLKVEICSVCNHKAMKKVFDVYHPQIVLHAAAHKHVPLMEHNCIEAVENNVFGTLNVVKLSYEYKINHFIMVSTDKAVNPTNVMGATKRMCEMIVMAYAKFSKTTIFTATRFGNVLGSAGSVIPLFKRQIANGGPITITDKRIIRYFMTIPEASQLVIASGAMAKNGELFVLDMGKPVKIYDLAINLIKLSGYEPYTDIEIVETGLRPGEKLYEELLIKSDTLRKTSNELIFIEKDDSCSMEEIEQKLSALEDAIKTESNHSVKDALHSAVPTFVTPEEINDKID